MLFGRAYLLLVAAPFCPSQMLISKGPTVGKSPENFILQVDLLNCWIKIDPKPSCLIDILTVGSRLLLYGSKILAFAQLYI